MRWRERSTSWPGAETDVARARPVLEAFAGRVIHTGPTGSRNTMKLLNNFVSMGYAAIHSETLMLGAKAGLPPTTFDSVVRGGRMDCGFYQTFFKYVIERDENAHQFTIANALKDMTYMSSIAVNAGRQPDGPALRPHSVRHRGGIER